MAKTVQDGKGRGFFFRWVAARGTLLQQSCQYHDLLWHLAAIVAVAIAAATFQFIRGTATQRIEKLFEMMRRGARVRGVRAPDAGPRTRRASSTSSFPPGIAGGEGVAAFDSIFKMLMATSSTMPTTPTSVREQSRQEASRTCDASSRCLRPGAADSFTARLRLLRVWVGRFVSGSGFRVSQVGHIQAIKELAVTSWPRSCRSETWIVSSTWAAASVGPCAESLAATRCKHHWTDHQPAPDRPRARSTAGLTPYFQARCHYVRQDYLHVVGMEEGAYDAAFYMESSLHTVDSTLTFKETFRRSRAAAS